MIVGDGPQRAALGAQICRARSRANASPSRASRTTSRRGSRALDVFALPSYANEGVPQALLQAMFAGVPCVTTAVGAIPEIARDGETARVVPAEDPAALAAGIDALIGDPATAARLAAAARDFVVPRYALDTMLDRMEAVFRHAVAERGEARR